MRDPEFPGVEFRFEWPHPSGNVLMGALSDTSMVWGVRKGCSYPEEQHAQGHRLTIQRGCGIISICGVEQSYTAGGSFYIGGNVPHGFTRVEEATLVLQEDC